MMEALAIGLAVYGGVATALVFYWWQEAFGWRDLAKKAEALSDRWFEKCMAARRELQSLREQVATMDHDGNGKIGGSKPRGKG